MKPGSEQYHEALDLIRGWSRAWVITHTRADGDAIGSCVGVRQILRQIGIDATAFTFEKITPRYEFLVGHEPLRIWRDSFTAEADRIDGWVVVDTCAKNQLEPVLDLLEPMHTPVVVFDHHCSRDLDVTLGVFDESAAAASLMIAEWALETGITIDEDTCAALFAGMATDTGWYRFDNADARTFEMAAKLINRGVRPNELYNRLYCTDRPSKMAMLGQMLGTIELHADGKLVTAQVTREMMKACKTQMGDLEELVAELGRMGSAVYWALFTESEDGLVRVNLRSKHTVDVARIAEELGGGGHVRAAGIRIRGELAEVKARVLACLLREHP